MNLFSIFNFHHEEFNNPKQEMIHFIVEIKKMLHSIEDYDLEFHVDRLINYVSSNSYEKAYDELYSIGRMLDEDYNRCKKYREQIEKYLQKSWELFRIFNYQEKGMGK